MTKRGEFDLRFALPPELLGLEESISSQHLEGMKEVKQTLGEYASPLAIQPQARFEGSYFDSEKLVFDQEKLKAIRQGLLTDLQQLPPVEGMDFFSAHDLLKEHSKTQANSAEYFTKNLRRLLALSPFLFDRQGNASSEAQDAAERIQRATPLELQALYRDHFRVDLRKALFNSPHSSAAPQLKMEFPKVDAQFVEKVLLPATVPVTETGGPVRTQNIVLEQVPAPYTLFRSAFGQDCSSTTIPYYGLHRDARVFWIYPDASPSKSPIGYVFVLEIEYQGHKLPYVVTVNGSNFSTAKTRKVIESVAGLYGTEEILLSSEKAEHVVNTGEIEKAFREFRGRLIRLPSPLGWEKLETLNFYNAPGAGGYYGWDGKLGAPRLAKVKPLAMKNLPSTNRYLRKQDFSAVEKVRRAKAYVEWMMEGNKGRRIRRVMGRHGGGLVPSLKVTFESDFQGFNSLHPDTLDLLKLTKTDILPVYFLSARRISPEDAEFGVQRFFEIYGFDPKQIRSLVDLEKEAEIALLSYAQSPNPAPLGGWKNWFDRLHRTMVQKFYSSEDVETDLLLRPTLFPREFGEYDQYDFFVREPRPSFIPKGFQVLLEGPAESRIALIESLDTFGVEDPGTDEVTHLFFQAKEDIVRKYRLLSKPEQKRFAKTIQEKANFAFTSRYRTVSARADEEKAQTIAYFLREKFLDFSESENSVTRHLFGSRWSQVQRYVELRKKGLIGSEIDSRLLQTIIQVDPKNAENYWDPSNRTGKRAIIRADAIERLALDLVELSISEGTDPVYDLNVDFSRANGRSGFKKLQKVLGTAHKTSGCKKLLLPKKTGVGPKRR
jgi:hypothetical protein